ncbi:MAG: shikimate dehydrogenase [Fuerstiella sp.]|nr:shikimate dehydrogenase [Fuerstiella sp.]MCP4855679.1 shikimate dehydrogenase [Fuerstiella sp.]
MTPFDFRPADRPTFYFIGVTTTKSSIMKVFPLWAQHLGLGDCPIRGIDCQWHDDPEVYRKIVNFLKKDELSQGALVTTHKLDLLKAARDLFDGLGPYARQLDEVSSISKRNGKLLGHAKDPITSGLSLDAFVPGDYWARTGGEICILGAGGSSLALTISLMQRPNEERPTKIHVTNRSEKRLAEMQKVHDEIAYPIPIEYRLCPTASENDQVVAQLKPHSLVINATGLGKDAPGSPLSEAAEFPENGLAWDFNYRGDLVFLDQARAQKEAKQLHVEDGWVYFIHGWTQVIAEVFDIDIPTSGPGFEELSRIAAETRRYSVSR